MSSLSSLPAAILATIVLLLAGHTAARDLRPSQHGLLFQASPPANSSPEMKSFFSTTKGSSSSYSSSSSNADSPLRNATEPLPPAWWGVTGGGGGRSHMARALMTASLVCGITGGVLLVASGLLYLFKHRKKQHQNAPFHPCNNNNNNNINNININDRNNNNNNSTAKLQLVPVVSNS